jgi:hypothetical protein
MAALSVVIWGDTGMPNKKLKNNSLTYFDIQKFTIDWKNAKNVFDTSY